MGIAFRAVCWTFSLASAEHGSKGCGRRVWCSGTGVITEVSQMSDGGVLPLYSRLY